MVEQGFSRERVAEGQHLRMVIQMHKVEARLNALERRHERFGVGGRLRRLLRRHHA